MASVSRASLDQKQALAKRCPHAVLATVATVVPTFASVRMLPWARTNLNPTAQALIISTEAAGMAYFIVVDKTCFGTKEFLWCCQQV